jgi:trehalose-phosphatase
MRSGTPGFIIRKSDYDAVIFDLDGVVTKTAKVHAAAWKELFDQYLEKRSGEDAFQPFDLDSDYRGYVDGKPCYEGVKSFLASRNIELSYGSPDDGPEKETVCGLGNRKNSFFLEHLERGGVEVYRSAVELIGRLRRAGLKTAVVSSSENCVPVLKAANIGDLFDAKLDGVDAERVCLAGKPAPGIFLKAAEKLDVDPGRAAVVEDAIAGVQAGKRGQFGCVVGVDRTGDPEVLKNNGADVVVTDLSEIRVGRDECGVSTKDLPSASDAAEEISKRAENKRLALFLDYDGTLTPIVARPEEAILSDSMRRTLKELAEHCIVAIISGRDLPDVRRLVGIETIFYGGSHGFEIAGPKARHIEAQQGKAYLPALDTAQKALEERLADIPGAVVERTKFSIAAHYRNVEEGREGVVEEAVDRVLSDHPELRKTGGKKIYELQPEVDWNKGKALLWLIEKLGLDRPEVLPLYIGDDVTDEDAFRVLAGRGIGIVVRDAPRSTAAQYALEGPDAVQQFLRLLLRTLISDQ